MNDILSNAERQKRAQAQIVAECDRIKCMLLEKNASYGNSALDPIHVFAPRADAQAGIRFRLDDKLTRIAKGDGRFDEDTIGDIIGYLVLLHIAERASPVTEAGKEAVRLDQSQREYVPSEQRSALQARRLEVDKLSQSLNAAHNRAKKAEQEHERDAQLLRETATDLEKMIKDREELKAEIERLKAVQPMAPTWFVDAAACIDCDDLRKQMEEMRSTMREKVNDALAQRDMAREELKSAKAELDETFGRFRHLEDILQTKACRDCQQECDAARKERDDARAAIAEIHSQASTKITSLEAERDEAIKQRDAALAETKAVNDEAVNLGNASLARITQLEHDMHTMSDHATNLQRERDEACNERSAMVSKVLDYNRTIAEEKRISEDYNSCFQRIVRERNELMTEVSRLRTIVHETSRSDST